MQSLLPLVLLGLLTTLLRARAVVFWTSAVAVAIAMLAVHLMVFHGVIPGWTIWIGAILWGMIVLRRLYSVAETQPSRRIGHLAVALPLGLLGFYGASLVAEAVAGRTAPEDGVIDLAMPLGPGRYIVAQGGATEAVNGHLKTLDDSVPRFAAWRGQSYAVDLLGLDRFGWTHDVLVPTSLDGHVIFGAPVHAPCAGTVLKVVRDMPDNIPPHPDLVSREGNHVLLDCDGVHILLAHFRNGTLGVEAGAQVATGTYLGEVGNSGASTAPHLHIHAQTPGNAESPLSGEPLHIRLDGVFPVLNDHLPGLAWP